MVDLVTTGLGAGSYPEPPDEERPYYEWEGDEYDEADRKYDDWAYERWCSP